MKLRIDNIEIECTPREAAELIAEFKTNRVNVPYEGQPTWRRFPPDSTPPNVPYEGQPTWRRFPPDSTPPYVITVSGTLDQNKIAERCKTVWRTV